MDQDSFRKLLATPHAGNSQTSRASSRTLLPSRSKTKEPSDASGSQVAFKPRKIKRSQANQGPYRDRAAERRSGVSGDFAEVEAVLESFEKETANDEDRQAVEEKRHFLGGDSEHTVLVKGLDFALLEQTKTHVTINNVEDDEKLEEVFQSVQDSKKPSDPSSVLNGSKGSRKRTREDLIRELKERRGDGPVGKDSVQGTDAKSQEKTLEDSKKAGKFKPIGFKPIVQQMKSVKGKGDDSGTKKKKKKQKVATAQEDEKEGPYAAGKAKKVTGDTKSGPQESSLQYSSSKTTNNNSSAPHTEPDSTLPPDEDFDIFAGAGDYKGLDFDDDDDESEEETGAAALPHPSVEPEAGEASPKPRWFASNSDDDEPHSSKQNQGNTAGRAAPPDASRESKEKRQPSASADDPHEDSPPRTIRLAPLASSAVPSIKDILAADSALEVEEKRKARKEKRKAGGGGGGGEDGGEGKKKAITEAKLNRDYQKLKSYTAKKDGAASSGNT